MSSLSGSQQRFIGYWLRFRHCCRHSYAAAYCQDNTEFSNGWGVDFAECFLRGVPSMFLLDVVLPAGALFPSFLCIPALIRPLIPCCRLPFSHLSLPPGAHFGSVGNSCTSFEAECRQHFLSEPTFPPSWSSSTLSSSVDSCLHTCLRPCRVGSYRRSETRPSVFLPLHRAWHIP